MEAQSWITKSYDLFKKQYVIFICFFLTETILIWGIRHFPLLGLPVSMVVSSLLGIGWLYSAQKADSGTTLVFKDLFLGFSLKFIDAVIYTVIYLALMGVCCIPMVFGVGFEFVKNFFFTDHFNIPQFTFVLAMAGILSLLLFALLLMACTFALPLMTYQNMQPFEAMKKSFDACSKYIWPLTWYGLLLLGLLFLCALTLGLGVLVVVPLIRISQLYAYEDIFKATKAAPSPLTSGDQLSTL